MKLSDILGKRIVDADGYVTNEFGDDVLVFKISHLVLDTGATVSCGGEHDLPYAHVDQVLLEKHHEEGV